MSGYVHRELSFDLMASVSQISSYQPASMVVCGSGNVWRVVLSLIHVISTSPLALHSDHKQMLVSLR
jgi:hypothetical protein